MIGLISFYKVWKTSPGESQNKLIPRDQPSEDI